MSSGTPRRKGSRTTNLAVPQGSPQKSSAAPQAGAAPPQMQAQAVEDQQRDEPDQPGGLERASYGSRRPTAPGESPCTHTESTAAASSTACAAIPSGSVEQGARLVAGQQPAVGVVAAVGEPLDVRRRPRRRGQRQQQRPGHARAPAASPDPASTAAACSASSGDPVVERAVRLEVAHPRPPRPRDRRQRRRPARRPARAARPAGTSQRDPAEASPGRRRTPARRPRPRAGRLGADGAHRGRRAGVEAAGDVGAGHDARAAPRRR